MKKIIKFFKKFRIFIITTLAVIGAAAGTIITYILIQKENIQIRKNEDVIFNIKKEKKENEEISNNIDDDFNNNPFNKSRNK